MIKKIVNNFNEKIEYKLLNYWNCDKYRQNYNLKHSKHIYTSPYILTNHLTLFFPNTEIECFYWHNTKIIGTSEEWALHEDHLMKWLNGKGFTNKFFKLKLQLIKINKKEYFIDKNKNFYQYKVLEIRKCGNYNVRKTTIFYEGNKRTKQYLRSSVLTLHSGKYLANKYKNKIWKDNWKN